jgi:hypothetical protein
VWNSFYFSHFLSLFRQLLLCTSCCGEYIYLCKWHAGPNGCAVLGVGLRPLACWECGFESHGGHGCLCVVSVVCCQVDVSATSWSSPTDCGASLCVM